MSNSKLKFKEKTHEYSLNGKKLISASQLVKLFTPEFDKFGHITRAVAKRDGLTVEQVKKKWKDIGDAASKKGKKFHSAVESYIETGIIPEDEHKDLIIQFSKIEFKGKLKTEFICFSETDLLAGTMDICEMLDENTANIWDHKTNKKLDYVSKYGSKMLKPLEHLADTNINHYFLQQNLYKHLLEKMGIWVENMSILHINPETQKIDIHPVRFMSEEVKEMLKYHKQIQEIEDFI